MICSVCGTPQSMPVYAHPYAGARFCCRCGTPLLAPHYLPPQRVSQNLKPLAIVWLVYGGYRVLAGALALFAFRLFGRQAMFGETPHVFAHLAGALLPLVGAVAIALAVATILTGVGLLTRAPWARTLAIVMGVLALLHPPLGTALGIYTLWVLGPYASAAEYRTLQLG